jgi:hypothetical protein
MKNYSLIGTLLIVSAVCVLLGRGYEYLFWDTPIRVLMWRQDWISGFVELFGFTWEEYASSPTIDKILNFFSRSVAFFFIVSAFAVCFIKSFKQVGSLLKNTFGVVLFIYILLFIDNFSRIGYFVEHSIQIGAVLMPVIYFQHKINEKGLFLILQWLVALTFIGHGMFAMAFYPVPGEFIDMLYYAFRFEEKTSLSFLYVIGIIDIVFGLYILLPISLLKILKPVTYVVISYFIVWGFFTAIARIYTGFAMSITIDSFHEEFYKFVFRIPHAIFPFILVFILKRDQ